MLQDKNLARKLNDEWDTKSPIILKFERNTPRLKYVSTVLRSEYLQNQTLSNDILLETFGKLLSDAIIGFPVHRFAHLAAKYVPVYCYRFSYKGRFSDFLYPGDTVQFIMMICCTCFITRTYLQFTKNLILKTRQLRD